MAIINSLPEYVEQNRLPLLRNLVIGNRSAKEFNLQTGIKGETAINYLNTEITFGDGSTCVWAPTGTSTLSQRTIKPGYIKVNMTFCDKDLLKTFANHEVRIAAGQKTLPFEEDFIKGVAENIAANLEKAMWQGDTQSLDPNLSKFDGIEKIVSNEASAIDVTVNSNDTATSILMAVYNAMPEELLANKEVIVYMKASLYRQYIQELIANGNLVITTGVNDVAMPASILMPGTNVRVIPVEGMANYAIASFRDNFVYGVDMAGDSEKIDLWYSQDNREFRLAVEFIAGVQVVYPELVVYTDVQAVH